MARLQWGLEGSKIFELGVQNGVLFVYDSKTKKYKKGVAWHGLTSAKITPEGGEETELTADNTKYASLTGVEKIKLGIEAYMYPEEFSECDGSAFVGGVRLSQQKRAMFAFSFQTKIGSDTDGIDKGYKIHLVYGCKAGVSERPYSSINDSPEAITFSWECSSTPQEVNVPNLTLNKTSYLTFDSTKISKEKMKYIEDLLYGSDTKESELPDINTLLNYMLTNG